MSNEPSTIEPLVLSRQSLTLFNNLHFSPNAPDPDNITVMDMGVLPMIRDFHHHGIRIDVPLLQTISRQISIRKREIESSLYPYIQSYQYIHPKTGTRTPFKIGSRDHLAQFLFEELRIQGDSPIPLTNKGTRFQVSEEILKPFSKTHPVVPLIIEWHSSNKIQTTYADPLPLLVDSDSRVHTKFNTTTTATGRLSSTAPNCQNIPTRTELGKKIREAFISSPGWVLVSTDFQQIEMVWAGHRSQDPTMLQVFRNGEDIHTRTTCNVFGLDYPDTVQKIKLCKSGSAPPDLLKWYKHFTQFQRLPCKTVGFGVLYGQTGEGLQSSLASEGVFWTEEECNTFIETRFFEVYPNLKSMLERDYARARRYGMIWDDFGRVRLVPEAKSHLKWIANEGTRKAGNHPEQAGAQGSIKIAMARLTPIARELGPSICRPLLQIHDELIWEVRKDWAHEVAYIMREEMESATPLSIPVRSSSDIAERWSDLK